MPDYSDLSPPSADGDPSAIDERKALPAPPASTSSNRSIMGLSLVSALNISCLIFIAHHFTTHDNEPGWTGEVKLRSGNVSFEPASANLLAIASHIQPTSVMHEVSRVEEIRTTSTALSALDGKVRGDPAPQHGTKEAKGPEHWVQLGALSKIATARAYWSTLQKNYAGLLGSYQPVFVGPDQVGGSLHHIRLGPLAAN